jgi:methyltransferase family protein
VSNYVVDSPEWQRDMLKDKYPNWFEMTARKNFERYLLPVRGKPDARFLQIGAYVGDATVWLMENVLTDPTSLLEDVDTWQGSPDDPGTDGMDFVEVERLYDKRTKVWRDQGTLEKYRMTSREYFAKCVTDWGNLEDRSEEFDFIYIDASHKASEVMHDAINAAMMLRHSGLLAFDDYRWHSGKGAAYDPGTAIDAFMSLYGDVYVIEWDAQVWIQRTW